MRDSREASEVIGEQSLRQIFMAPFYYRIINLAAAPPEKSPATCPEAV